MTRGYILLEGGSEFGGEMSLPDERAIALAGGQEAAISIIPTAAAADNNHLRAGQNGVRWFRSLGANRVAACRSSILPPPKTLRLPQRCAPRA